MCESIECTCFLVDLIDAVLLSVFCVVLRDCDFSCGREIPSGQ